MPRKTNIKIPGLNAWIDNIKNELSENAARDIVIDLKIAGPYWSGEFEALGRQARRHRCRRQHSF